MTAIDPDKARLESAARAAWLYFIAGNTQEEVARKLRISRPTAQRLVSLALSERLITFRFEHPLLACIELAERLRERFGLIYCDVVPTDPDKLDSLAGIAVSAASFIEQTLSAANPGVLAVGTGRALRAAVEQIRPLDARHHTLVALVGNIAPDGSASFYDVLTRLADLTQAKHYPISMPVLAESEEERDLLVSLKTVARVHGLAARADTTIIGVGQMDFDAPQLVDGFISRDELLELVRDGAVGELTGWSFDGEGRIMESRVNARLTSAPLTPGDGRLTVGVALGERKRKAIRAALTGRLLSGLITDEATAAALLDT